jgi:PKD repeat protein
MKTILLTILTSAILLSIQISPQNLIDGPESIAYHPGTNSYYVSSLRNNRIVKIDLSGNQTIFAEDVIAFGNCIKGDVLYVSGGDHVRGFDLYSGAEVFNAYLSGTTQLDGITADNDGYLYVIATQRLQIYRINISDSSSSVFVASGLEPVTQDIIYDPLKDRLLVCAFGAGTDILSVNPGNAEVTSLVTAVGGFDGITVDEGGFVFLGSYVSNGQIIMYDSEFQNGPIVFAENVGEPAGIDYNLENRTLAVPDFSGDLVRYFNVREDHLTVDFNTNVNSGHIPLVVEFSDLSFTDKDILKWEWDFNGDGVIDSELQNPTYTYNTAGYYDVTLTITTIVGSLSFTADEYIRVFSGESSVEFNAGTGHVDIGAAPELALNSDFTLEAAIKPYSWGSQITGSTIFDKGAVRLYIVERGFLGTKNESLVLLLTFDDNSLVKYAAPEFSISLDNWQHVAVSFNSSLVEPILFINGEEQTVNIIGTAPSGVPLKNNSTTNIKVANSINLNTGLIGCLDELRIWNYSADKSGNKKRYGTCVGWK